MKSKPKFRIEYRTFYGQWELWKMADSEAAARRAIANRANPLSVCRVRPAVADQMRRK